MASLIGLSGCSTLKIAYNNSDDVLYWWLDGYADLQDTQKPFTRDALADVLRWHRQKQLPEYIALLQKMRSMAPHDITPAQVCAVSQEMETSFVALLRYAEPASTRLASQLKPEQLRSIRKRYDKTNKDWRADWLDPNAEERLRYRTKQALNRLEDFYGRLDKLQRDTLEQWFSESMFDPAMSYAERERRQADSLQTLQRIAQDGQASAQTQSLLRGWVDRSLKSPVEQHRSYAQAFRQEYCAGFAKLHNSTTAAQRQRMVDALQGYENDLKILAVHK